MAMFVQSNTELTRTASTLIGTEAQDAGMNRSIRRKKVTQTWHGSSALRIEADEPRF
jgi:hypothetical protein